MELTRVGSMQSTESDLRRDSSAESLDESSPTQPFISQHTKESSLIEPVPSQYGQTESHQFEQNESEVWWHHQLQR
jgi:chromosome condensin MukBEF ATPase and DNA-binding subunit MukB